MKKLLFINDEMTIGGVETVLFSLLSNLDLTEYCVDLLLDYKTDRDKLFVGTGINVIYVYGSQVNKPSNRLSRYCRAILKELFPVSAIRIILHGNYDCVIDFKGASLSYLRYAKCPTVFWNHKDFSIKTNPYEKRYVEQYSTTPMGRFKQHFFKENISKCTYIVCISNTMKEHFIERYGYAYKVRTIYNVMDTEKIHKKSLQLIEDLPPKNKFTFGCISRITEGKGIERLLKSVMRLNDLGYIFSLVIVGAGDKFNDILAIKDKMALSNVDLIGSKENPYPYYIYSDAIVMPSENEAATLIVPEALVLNKALLATDVGSTAEMLDDSRYGFLLPNSEDGIFEGMKKILDEPDLVKMYEQINDNAEDRFGINHTMHEVTKFITEITERS